MLFLKFSFNGLVLFLDAIEVPTNKKKTCFRRKRSPSEKSGFLGKGSKRLKSFNPIDDNLNLLGETI